MYEYLEVITLPAELEVHSDEGGWVHIYLNGEDVPLDRKISSEEEFDNLARSIHTALEEWGLYGFEKYI